MIGSSASRAEHIFFQQVFMGFEHTPSNHRLTVDDLQARFTEPAKQDAVLKAIIIAVPPPYIEPGGA